MKRLILSMTGLAVLLFASVGTAFEYNSATLATFKNVHKITFPEHVVYAENFNLFAGGAVDGQLSNFGGISGSLWAGNTVSFNVDTDCCMNPGSGGLDLF